MLPFPRALADCGIKAKRSVWGSALSHGGCHVTQETHTDAGIETQSQTHRWLCISHQKTQPDSHANTHSHILTITFYQSALMPAHAIRGRIIHNIKHNHIHYSTHVHAFPALAHALSLTHTSHIFPHTQHTFASCFPQERNARGSQRVVRIRGTAQCRPQRPVLFTMYRQRIKKRSL